MISGEDPVVEFSFAGTGLDGVPTAASASASMLNKTTNDVKHIIYNGPDELFVPLAEDRYYSVYDRMAVDISSYEIMPLNDITVSDGIINWDDANIDSNSLFMIQDFGSGTDYWLMTDFSSGGVCSPTAATNVLWYWGNARGCSSVMDKVSSKRGNLNKAKAIFDILYDGMGTTEEGGTSNNKIAGGYAAFFGEGAGQGSWNYKKLVNGSSYTSYKTALNEHCPVHMALNTKNGLFDKGSGHSVMGIGYASSTSGAEYIFVMDGWMV